MSDRKNIKIPTELFNQLKEQKGQYRSWPQYLEDELTGDDSTNTKSNGGLQSGDIEDIKEQLEEIEYFLESVQESWDYLNGEEIHGAVHESDHELKDVLEQMRSLEAQVERVPEETAEEFGRKYR